MKEIRIKLLQNNKRLNQGVYFWRKSTYLFSRESPLGVDTTHFIPCRHLYFMGVWISVRDYRVEDVLFMVRSAADPSGLTLWAGCQIVVDPWSRETVRIYDYLPASMCVFVCEVIWKHQITHTYSTSVCVCVHKVAAAILFARGVGYDQYQVQTERHKDQWAVIMKSRPLMIISRLLMNLERHVC